MKRPAGTSTLFIVGLRGSESDTWQHIPGEGSTLAKRRADAMERFFAGWAAHAKITVEAARRMLGLEDALRFERYMRHRPGFRKTATTEAAYKKRRDQLQIEIEGLRRGEILVPKDVFAAKDHHEAHRILDAAPISQLVSAIEAPKAQGCCVCQTDAYDVLQRAILKLVATKVRLAKALRADDVRHYTHEWRAADAAVAAACRQLGESIHLTPHETTALMTRALAEAARACA